MEGRRGEEIPNSMGFGPPQIIQDSPLKLPLAPLFPTQHDRRGNPTVSTRRGSSIFSPTQTLDPPHHHHNLSPPPPQNGSTPNPDPPTSASDSRNQSPPQAPPPPPPPRPAGGVTTTTSSVIRYKECLKNHAASMGGHVVDGCGEFMPSGDDGTPQALRCAACDCHRNFHRREAEGQPQPFHSSHAYNPYSGSHRQTPAHHLQHKHSYPHGFATPPTMVSFGGNSGGAAAVESSSEDLNIFQSGDGAAQPKKRHRTKFRQDQKDRMHELATKLGWRIQKQDEQEVQEFCSEVGVKRQAFKIWMHNNKQAIKKRSSSEI